MQDKPEKISEAVRSQFDEFRRRLLDDEGAVMAALQPMLEGDYFEFHNRLMELTDGDRLIACAAVVEVVSKRVVG